MESGFSALSQLRLRARLDADLRPHDASRAARFQALCRICPRTKFFSTEHSQARHADADSIKNERIGAK